ncbi:MAG: hypothetical protein ACRDUB_09955, partial [Mycobacterium sp.]
MILLACAVLLAPATRAQNPRSESEILQARIEQVRDDPELRIDGAQIIAVDLAAELYARRGFTRAWSSPAASDDLLRAIRDSADDGLEPEDYLLGALESARSAAQRDGGSL